MTKKLDPMCFKGFPMAITKDGYLIPCCYCDVPETMNDLEFKKLLSVSKIDDYNTIEEILENDEWLAFENNLKNNIGPHSCWNTCSTGVDIRQNNAVDPETKEVKVVRTDNFYEGKLKK